MQDAWTTIFSTAAGGVVAMTLARAYITKLIKTVETLDSTVGALKTEVAVLKARVDIGERVQAAIQDHEKRIAMLEGRI